MLCYCIVSKNVYFPWLVWLLTDVCMHMTTKLSSRKPIQIPMIILHNVITKKLNIGNKTLDINLNINIKLQTKVKL